MNTAVRMEFGSTVYGTRLPTSDTDYKTVFIPSFRDLMLSRAKDSHHIKTKVDEREKNTAADIDEEQFSFRKYCELLAEGQTVAIDMLFVPSNHMLEITPAWVELVSNADRFLHSGAASFVGYCRKQANKYGIKGSRVAAMRTFVNVLHGHPSDFRLGEIWRDLETLEENEHISFLVNNGMPMIEVCNRKWGETCKVSYALKQAEQILADYGSRSLEAERNKGLDWKALSHAVRIATQAEELLLTGFVTFPRPEAALLLKIRLGELPYRQVAELIEQGIANVEAASEVSFLPKEPDRDWIDEFVYQTYLEHFDVAVTGKTS